DRCNFNSGEHKVVSCFLRDVDRNSLWISQRYSRIEVAPETIPNVEDEYTSVSVNADNPHAGKIQIAGEKLEQRYGGLFGYYGYFGDVPWVPISNRPDISELKRK